MSIPVAADGSADGNLVEQPGQLQYGPMLLGGGTSAGWRELVSWRDLPAGQVADSQRPQAHGAVPGSVYGDSLVVTYTFILRGTRADKLAAVQTIERHTPMDGVDRALVVNDGIATELRMARVIARTIPQDYQFRVGPLTCSIQFLCADPRRYSLELHDPTLRLPVSSGGLDYPVDYPADYGIYVSGNVTVTNDGNEPSPLVATFVGPLNNPVLHAPGWQLGFDLNLTPGETLTIDALAGTVLLNGSADRLYTIRRDSSPVEWAMVPVGVSEFSLTASGGDTGQVLLSFRDARM